MGNIVIGDSYTINDSSQPFVSHSPTRIDIFIISGPVTISLQFSDSLSFSDQFSNQPFFILADTLNFQDGLNIQLGSLLLLFDSDFFFIDDFFVQETITSLSFDDLLFI